ncbi:MAG TPA: ribose-5-phosphate isomerase RpiA [Ktedonobacteraceae bacterium]|nr:ribose-5-phosphate isomerase RpiA [Ktedonobacteraceae bacterium]
MEDNDQQDKWKRLAGEAAATFIEDGMVIGLGSGTTATKMIYALGSRIQQGLRITGAVATSHASENLARKLGIPLTDLDTHPILDLDIDGADEIDQQLRLIKGGGGALLREKIVASSARRFVVIADATKRVPLLGQHSPLPVETVPFAATPVTKHLEALGAIVQLRRSGDNVFFTENCNIILDCFFANGIADPVELDTRIQSIVGVVETGLFLHMAERAIIGGPEGITVLS